MKTITFGRILRLAANKYLSCDATKRTYYAYSCNAVNEAAKELGIRRVDRYNIENVYGTLSSFDKLFSSFIAWNVDISQPTQIQLQRFMHLHLMAEAFGNMRFEVDIH